MRNGEKGKGEGEKTRKEENSSALMVPAASLGSPAPLRPFESRPGRYGGERQCRHHLDLLSVQIACCRSTSGRLNSLCALLKYPTSLPLDPLLEQTRSLGVPIAQHPTNDDGRERGRSDGGRPGGE